MANEKMTNVKALNAVLNGEVITDEIREKLEKMKASYERKSASGEHKPTATQVANIKLKERIVEAMSANEVYTATQIAHLVTTDEVEITTSKASAMLRQLKEEGLIVKFEEKRKPYFKLA